MSFKGEIPGMYYDKEKERYFNIQANAPAQSAYSSQDVKRRKLEERRTQTIAEEKARQKGRIRRPILEPLASGLLAREHGNTGGLDGPRIFAKGIVSQGYSSDLFGPPYSFIFAVHKRADLGPSIIDLISIHDNQLAATQIDADLDSRNEKASRVAIQPLESPGTSTSISVHEEMQRVVVTWMAGSPNSGISILAPWDENGPGYITKINLGPGHLRGREVDISSSTAAPESSSLLFAIGTSEGILTIDKQSIDGHWLSRNRFPPGHSRDLFALEFLSNDPSVLLSGGRSGVLHITDLRVPGFGQQADTIKHRSSITHIKQLDPHRIIVAGLESSLCQYDLRFRKGPKRTQSILQYPDYQNTASIQIGFDVDLESGVVAAAQEHDLSHPHVQLFSLHGGHPLESDVSGVGGERSDYPRRPPHIHSKVRPPNPALFPTYRPIESSEVIPCLKFARDVDGKMKSLYIAAEVIRKYAWGSKGEGIKLLEGW